MIGQQAFLFHLAELERQSAALNGEKVRELLAENGMSNSTAPRRCASAER